MNKHLPKKADSKKFPTTISPACRAKVMAAPDLMDCLTQPTFYCEYKLHFGSGCFCRHPKRMEIAGRTEAEKRGKKG